MQLNVIRIHEINRESDQKSGILFTFEEGSEARAAFISRVNLVHLEYISSGEPPEPDAPLLDMFETNRSMLLRVASKLHRQDGGNKFEITAETLRTVVMKGASGSVEMYPIHAAT